MTNDGEDRSRSSRVHSILVVEDDPSHQELIRKTLEFAGHHVEVRSSLHEALELLALADGETELVVLDLDLPDHHDGNTVEIVRTVRNLPVIVHSAADRPTLDRAVAAGAFAAVAKGSSPDTLTTAVLAAFSDLGTDRHPPPPVPEDLLGSSEFSELAEHLVGALGPLTGVDTWLVTRVIDDDWIVLAANDETFGIRSGDVLRWSDSVCARMVHGLGPNVVVDLAAVDVYRRAPIVEAKGISCYVGMPIAVAGHGLFGTLCGIAADAHTAPDRVFAAEPTLRLITRMLASALAADLARNRLERRLEVADAAARSDSLTGVGNRRAWDRALLAEDKRCERFGHSAAIVMVDLDGLKLINDDQGHPEGDALIRRAADALRVGVREFDQVFRIGGDEFAVLLPEVGPESVWSIEDRTRQRLADAGVSASVGAAIRHPNSDLQRAAESADAAMYRDKAR